MRQQVKEVVLSPMEAFAKLLRPKGDRVVGSGRDRGTMPSQNQWMINHDLDWYWLPHGWVTKCQGCERPCGKCKFMLKTVDEVNGDA